LSKVQGPTLDFGLWTLEDDCLAMLLSDA